MNKLTIIGNLTRDPDMRTTTDMKNVCSFSVAVNRYVANGRQITEYFRVSAWGKLAESCHQYLTRGRKVAVVGPVSLDTYEDSNGVKRSALNVLAEEVEFLSPKREDGLWDI